MFVENSVYGLIIVVFEQFNLGIEVEPGLEVHTFFARVQDPNL